MTRAEAENSAARTFRGWKWARKWEWTRARWEAKLQEKLQVARRRLVAAVPVGASAEKKKELYNENHVILKEEEVQNAGRS